MSEFCETEEREATISMTFTVCKEHGHVHADSAMLSSSGVIIDAVADVALGTLEESIMVSISEHPPLKEFVLREYGGEALPERAQRQILKLLAHQILLRRVAERAYVIGIHGAHLSIPRNPDAG